jgi:uncharacterized protein involved in exopolysaccharide biosynthesis
MNDLSTRWSASHDRMQTAKSALDEAYRAKHPSRQQIEQAHEAYRAAVAAHHAILAEQRAEMEAEFAAEEAATVAAVADFLKGK